MFDEDEIFDLNLHFVTAINKGKESITTDGEDKDKNPSIIAINKGKDKVVDESSPIVTMNKGKDTTLDESSITIARDKHKANTSYLSHPMVKVDDISVPCLERERGERREERREKEAEMGKVVEEKKKKKKGRPSLLDLQKRSIKQEQEQEQLQQQKQNSNSNPNPNLKSSTVSSTPVRRSTRRNPNPDPEEDENDTVAAAEDEEELSGRRREKKLKLVLRLPSQLNSASLNSASCGSDSNAEEENVPASHKKRKINAIGDGSGHVDSEKAEKPISGASNQQGTELDGGPATPLPDKKLLVFVLDRLQKKDSYGVFSEPVDPKELPDYHEVIEHPMDFGTVRKNLAGGAYASLEQFEECSWSCYVKQGP
uniref:Bromo domain-containing protein n=1 Tax=Vitis vinifera TaxID=29760 RepID=F6I0R8_VITVI